MKKWGLLFTLLLFVVGCQEKAVTMPEDIPDFVQQSDITAIDWDRKAVHFGNLNNIVGNKDKIGVIGADTPSLNTQKWMWHLWGDAIHEDTKLTVVGYHKASNEIYPLLVDGWHTTLGGPNNGANAHAPTSVKVPKAGDWAVLVYADNHYFDTLVYTIND
ncbi:hypothetical protein [Lysinibacillus piscis]|uniref:DUF4871 domain-containing protein n=1 Tax=Lysinibacillus piscis TaxID=2518931 RepID=A0ABQ5NMJ1_9BACI|nr:hypothetical protein [Lysinibacillus sp. KH24]GLC89522.1 hypothetical protein LYSBPC_26490 [Lysinibacillus sp. KH24]